MAAKSTPMGTGRRAARMIAGVTMAGAGLAGVLVTPAARAMSSGGGAAQPAPSSPLPPAAGATAQHDAEPGIARAGDGVLWATSTVIRGANAQDIWKSTDHGATWQWVADPFNLDGGVVQVGGNDADIAAAPEKNPLGSYNVYAASLRIYSDVGYPAGELSLAVSPDGGTTWVVHPVAGELPGDDRPWVAADGPCRVYLTYHAVVANVVNTYDLCNPAATVEGLTLTPIAATRYPSLAVPFITGQPDTYTTAGFGKTVVDTSPASPYRHQIYIPMTDCPSLTPSQEIGRAEALQADCPDGTNAEVYMAVGTADGTHWDLRPVAQSSRPAVAIWPATAAVDEAGRVYIAWHDNMNSFLQWSDDGGSAWSAPRRVNPTGTAVYPTVAALAGGRVGVAWYGTDAVGDANDGAAMSGAVWQLRWVTLNPSGTAFRDPLVLDADIHHGALCTRGDQCSLPARDLLDDFGAIADPSTGLATIVYTSDRPGGSYGDDVTRSVQARLDLGPPALR